jgi:Fur family ferric uptake transcriptional regulator
MASLDIWLSHLQQGGYRLTAARRAVAQTLLEQKRGLTPQEVFALARRRHPNLGLVSVYRALDVLERLGLVQRLHREDGCNAYCEATSGHQHVLLCRVCGRMVFFGGDDLEPLITEISARTGFHITGHLLQLDGLCPNCQRKEQAES